MATLLQKNFSSTASDLQKLQCSDLKLRSLYDKSKAGNQPGYVIISKLLYKLGPKDSHILCVPEILCKQIVADSHSRFGFHLKVHQLGPILKPLIFIQSSQI